MGIVVNSVLPHLVLQLNVVQKQIFYKGITKSIPETFWKSDVVTRLYPLWDTDKDKLIVFTWYDNNTYHAQRRKFIKNFQTNEYEWRDYEMEKMNNDEALKLYNFFKDTFFLIDSLENEEFQSELASIYAETSSVNWLTIRLARNFLLTESDWIFATDANIDDESKEMWKKYRQSLRDLPTSISSMNPEEIKFPINPTIYTKLFIENNPGVGYLETPDQWMPLAYHHLTTFREKMVRYLIVKEVTDQLYFDSFMRSMREMSNRNEINSMFDERVSNSEKLDQLISLIEEGKIGVIPEVSQPNTENQNTETDEGGVE